jgi:hypothetical protein
LPYFPKDLRRVVNQEASSVMAMRATGPPPKFSMGRFRVLGRLHQVIGIRKVNRVSSADELTSSVPPCAWAIGLFRRFQFAGRPSAFVGFHHLCGDQLTVDVFALAAFEEDRFLVGNRNPVASSDGLT